MEGMKTVVNDERIEIVLCTFSFLFFYYYYYLSVTLDLVMRYDKTLQNARNDGSCVVEQNENDCVNDHIAN